jgi:hypothetical protein
MGLLSNYEKIRSVVFGAAFAAASLLAGVQSANATFVLGTGNVGGLGDNVIINSCVGNTVGPAPMVQGCLNGSHTTLLDVSTSTGNLTGNGGQARFDATGGNKADYAFKFDDLTLGFKGIVLNINAAANSNVTFTISAVDSLGNAEVDQTFTDTLSKNGNNFFNLISSDGEVAKSLLVTSSLSNIADVRQVRIDSEDVPVKCTGDCCTGNCCTTNCGPPPSVPEPATLFLLGSALLGYGASQRRKPV